MPTTHEQNLQTKLRVLNPSSESINTVAEWIMFHESKSSQSVAIWEAELKKAPVAHKIHLIYLCNDILQKTRGQTLAFVSAFHEVLPRSLHHTYHSVDDKDQARLQRILNIWAERQLFVANDIEHLRAHMMGAVRQLDPFVETFQRITKDLTDETAQVTDTAAGIQRALGNALLKKLEEEGKEALEPAQRMAISTIRARLTSLRVRLKNRKARHDPLIKLLADRLEQEDMVQKKLAEELKASTALLHRLAQRPVPVSSSSDLKAHLASLSSNSAASVDSSETTATASTATTAATDAKTLGTGSRKRSRSPMADGAVGAGEADNNANGNIDQTASLFNFARTVKRPSLTKLESGGGTVGWKPLPKVEPLGDIDI